MKLSKNGKGIIVSHEEAVKLETIGFVFVCNADGDIIAIVQKDKIMEALMCEKKEK